jgi:hypothetical protein
MRAPVSREPGVLKRRLGGMLQFSGVVDSAKYRERQAAAVPLGRVRRAADRFWTSTLSAKEIPRAQP